MANFTPLDTAVNGAAACPASVFAVRASTVMAVPAGRAALGLGVPSLVRMAAVLHDRPGALRRGDLAEHGPGHVAVVVRPGTRAETDGQVDRADREPAVADRTGVRVDPLGVARC